MKQLQILILFFVFSCTSSNADKHIYLRAKVERVGKYHVGGGLYNSRGYYKYSFENVVYEGSYKSRNGRVYNANTISEGDSVLIKVLKRKPQKNEFIRVTYHANWIKVE